ncbi:MAG: ATP-binding protein [Hominenteromicrobium sp.]
MKLWQKVSLTALVFVMLAIQLTQFFVLERSFENSITRERQLAVSAHEALSASLSNHAAYQRLKAGKLLLSTDEIADLLENTVTADISTASAIAVFLNGTLVTAAGDDLFGGAEDYGLTLSENLGEGQTVIHDIDGSTYLIVASAVQLEMLPYTLYTAFDITDVYAVRAQDLASSRTTGLICGTAISAALLVLVWIFLHPLKVSVRTIGEIANGNYSLRVPERGSAELETLARSINHMSASIDEREQKLREIADSRKRFADSMAHEMKTPLTSILGFADILRIKSSVSDAQRRDYAATIVEEAKRLRGLSAKLLQLASTDSTQLDFAEVPVAQLFGDIANTMAPILARRGIHLEIMHKNAVLRVDRELFLSLLYNLIDNAAKASPEGASVWLVQSALDGHTVLSVIDQGIGMKPDTVRRATEAFYMADKARSRKAGGAGLGLALCDDICRRHGARLEIRSTYQKGTTILIHMDVAPPQAAEITAEKKTPKVQPTPRAAKKKPGKRRQPL